MSGKASPQAREPAFAIVGIGASAGGIDAITELLRHLPVDTGMAFVVVQHLDPKYPSQLSAVLVSATDMPIVEVKDGMAVSPNHVYVTPSGVELSIADGILILRPRHDVRGRPPASIDTFFRALGDDVGGRAIGVLLSGMGADGTEGLRAIKAAGGLTIAQDTASAKFSAMPDHAGAAGVADMRLPPSEIAAEIARLGGASFATRGDGLSPSDDQLKQLLLILRHVVGVDFVDYKTATVRRRILRRAVLCKMRTYDEYLALLRDDPVEAQVLADEILIRVTGFFRDPASFAALQHTALAGLAANKSAAAPIRVWVPGCSTGEEVYSLAICLIEAMSEAGNKRRIQLFGSDVSDKAIRIARAGIYTEAAVSEITPERLARFFVAVEGGYRVNRTVRDLCVFARHDVARDPPFVKQDLISCRNVLIYFGAPLQRKVVATFHYCMNPGGFLFLGHSEGLSGFSQLFTPIDAVHKIFRASAAPRSEPAPMVLTEALQSGLTPQPLAEPLGAREAVLRRADSVLLDRFAPPGVVVDEKLQILQFRGRTGAYLEPAPGAPILGLLTMAKEGLLAAIHDAVAAAAEQKQDVRREGVQVNQGERLALVDIEVIPLPGDAADACHYLVLFEDPASPLSAPAPGEIAARAGRGEIETLRRELAACKERLQATLHQGQHHDEALKAINEELIAGNEELQSTNEELQTAKEELQSSNEELSTVNDELHDRNQELNQTNSDMINLLASVDIPVVIVGGDRCIRRFTPRARTIMNLIPSDVGRPIDDIKPNIVVSDLEQRIDGILETLQVKEWEVQDKVGHWYRLQIRPYRTVDDRIDGVVISLIDIDLLKHAVGKAERARDNISSIVDTIRIPLMILDPRAKVIAANPAFYRAFACDPGACVDKNLGEIEGGLFDTRQLRAIIENVQQSGEPLEDIRVEIGAGEQRRVLQLSLTPIHLRDSDVVLLMTIIDVSERESFEQERANLLEAAQKANRVKDTFLATLSHELRTPLSSILGNAEMLLERPEPATQHAAQAIVRAAKAQTALIEDLLDISRINAGKLRLDLKPLDLSAVVEAAVGGVGALAAAKQVRLDRPGDGAPMLINGDALRLQQVVWNLLTNAIKFSTKAGVVTISLTRDEGDAELRVIDHGAGISAEFLPHIFELFSQAHIGLTRRQSGLGIGLALVRDIVLLHGGSVHAHSEGNGKGATFVVRIPIMPAVTQDDKREQVQAKLPPRAISLAGARVLIVDDDQDTLDVMSQIVSLAGAEVVSASTPTAALEAVRRFAPHVLLCDISMPTVDGYALLAKLRRAAWPRNLRAAAITALASEDDQRRALAAGFERHLTKPVAAADLRAAVMQLIAGSHPSSEGHAALLS